MIGHIYAAIYLIPFMVFTTSGAEVYLIDATSKKGNVRRLTLSTDKKSLVLDPISSDDSRILQADQLYERYNHPERQLLLQKQNRIFGNMFGNPHAVKKYRNSRYDIKNQLESLEPIIRYILNHKASNSKQFQDLTRNEKSFAEDYVDFGRAQSEPDFSQDYIDFRTSKIYPKLYRLRRATDVKKDKKNEKDALRSYHDSEDEDDDDEDEDTKSKRFEVVKNKHNKKEIKGDSDEESSEENDYEETKKAKKSKVEDLDSDEDFSEFSDKDTKPQKIGKQAKKKKESDEDNNDNERPELYLQGNKLTMYPPMQGDSDEGSDDDNRRDLHRRMRMPYFLPKRYHWTQKDIPNLGYFFFNGPKGISQETD